MVQVEIRCPSCGKRKKIEIDDDIINKSSRGVAAINIAPEQICSHTFVAYVDKNLMVRDCFIADFQLELPQIETEKKTQDRDILASSISDVEIIKENLHALSLTFILRSAMFKKKIFIIKDDVDLHQHILNLFNFIFKDSFQVNIEVGTKDEWKDKKKKLKKHIVIEDEKVRNDKEKLMDPKKIKIERTIIQKFLAENDPKSSLIILKNEIQKAYELSTLVIDLIDNYDGSEKLGKKKLIDMLSDKAGIKVSFSYLEFLLDILKYFINYDLSVLSDYYFPAFGI